MTQDPWNQVDDYFGGALLPTDPALAAALESSAAARLPAIQVSALQGKLLHLLALGATRVLEVGTLGGYSTIWLARALAPAGKLISLELEPAHAEVARANLARAGLADRVEVRVGPAMETLPGLDDEGFGPIDFTFIDADKQHNADYFSWALKLSRPGALIVVDNVVRRGAVAETAAEDSRVQGVRRLVELVAGEPRVSATAIQTVGAKGYDGFLLARVLK